MLTTVARISKLEAGREIQLIPFLLVLPAIVVVRLEVVAPVEIELPAVFAKLMRCPTPARAIPDMVIDHTIIDECTGPLVEVCFGIAPRIRNRYKLTLVDVLSPAD